MARRRGTYTATSNWHRTSSQRYKTRFTQDGAKFNRAAMWSVLPHVRACVHGSALEGLLVLIVHTCIVTQVLYAWSAVYAGNENVTRTAFEHLGNSNCIPSVLIDDFAYLCKILLKVRAYAKETLVRVCVCGGGGHFVVFYTTRSAVPSHGTVSCLGPPPLSPQAAHRYCLNLDSIPHRDWGALQKQHDKPPLRSIRGESPEA